MLKLNQQTVCNWIDQGALPALNVGRRVRIRRLDFDALLERGRATGRPPAGPSPAQLFWEEELLPVPTVNPGAAV
jgi:excisionase family DNA binding protein